MPWTWVELAGDACNLGRGSRASTPEGAAAGRRGRLGTTERQGARLPRCSHLGVGGGCCCQGAPAGAVDAGGHSRRQEARARSLARSQDAAPLARGQGVTSDAGPARGCWSETQPRVRSAGRGRLGLSCRRSPLHGVDSVSSCVRFLRKTTTEGVGNKKR